MNGGIHDAINLTSRLVEVWHGAKAEAELERYDRQRRLVTLEYIEKQSIQNKRNLESDGIEFAPQPGRDRGRQGPHLRVPAAGVHARQPAPRAGAGLSVKYVTVVPAQTGTHSPETAGPGTRSPLRGPRDAGVAGCPARQRRPRFNYSAGAATALGSEACGANAIAGERLKPNRKAATIA